MESVIFMMISSVLMVCGKKTMKTSYSAMTIYPMMTIMTIGSALTEKGRSRTMSDLISRQDAIDALDGIIVVGGRNSAVRMMGYIKAVRDRLKQLPSAQPELKWIPCSERLPEQGKPVLVTYIYNGKRFVAESWYIGLHDERGNPLFSSCADEYKASDLYFQKVAWMPLPEPWKGEQE